MDPSQIGFGMGFGGNLPVSTSLMSRFEGVNPDLQKNVDAFLRGDFAGDTNQLMLSFSKALGDLQRGITVGTSSLPIRENLEAEAKVLVPVETPFRNRLPRVPGAGTAASWRVVTSLGGGWGSSYDQPGGGSAAQMFFAETGAPANETTAYASRSASYKLAGEIRSVTGLAQAAGMTFQDNFATERTNGIRNMMLKEEFALINGDSTATAVPFGDGTNAYAYDGVINLIATANGTPSANIQTSVGALTLAHIDAQLTRQWKQGAKGMYMLLNAQEVQSIKNLAMASTSVHRVILSDQGSATVGIRVQGYTHPITGEIVPIFASRFVPAGTMLFLADSGPQYDPVLQVDVLPTVQLPEYSMNDPIQGYVAQEIMPTAASPLVYGFIIFVMSVLKLKIATCVCKSTGVTAV
ncbi:MAG: hypothetical protein GC165_07475 [Armatimonadetes bacterium]|nr:hypothetical protein [Armatimonadota bacterium]